MESQSDMLHVFTLVSDLLIEIFVCYLPMFSVTLFCKLVMNHPRQLFEVGSEIKKLYICPL